MSKTSKIRRLKRQIDALQNKVGFLEWTNNRLLKETSIKAPSQYYTPRPVFRSQAYKEEDYFNAIIEYLYSKMDNEYRKAYDFEDNVGEIRFTVYMSNDLVNNLYNIAGFTDFYRNGNIEYFRGHKVVRVIGEKDYVDFVRSY